MMGELNRYQHGSLLAVILFIASAYSEILDQEFELVPIDKISYYGRRQGVLQICVPPAGGGSGVGVEWRKGNKTLQSDNRISIYASKNVKKYVKHLKRDIRKVYVLEIKPVVPDDAGEYTCVDLSSQQEAKFRIILVDMCDKRFFKCLKGNVECVVNATLCDGNSDCDDVSDESVDVGCSYPPTPRNLRVVAKSWDQVKLTWSAVKQAISYDVRNNEDELINVTPEKTDAVFEGLRSGELYTFSVRAKSYTGYSNFSTAVAVVTRLYNGLDVPGDVSGTYVNGVGIIVCWQHVKGAIGYQITTDFRSAERSNKTFNVTRSEFIFKQALQHTTYYIRVRQWTGFEYSKFSRRLIVQTRPRRGKITDISIDVNSTVTLSWKNLEKDFRDTESYRVNSRLYCVTYALETCQRISIYHYWMTNETLVSDVKILNYYNATKNRTEEVSFKNYTIHYEQQHKALLRYDNHSCEVMSSDVLHFELDDLVIDSNYSYIVRVLVNGRVAGEYTEGIFPFTGYAPLVIPKPVSFFTGVVIYGISCIFLVIALIVSFIIAYYCKWNKLMADVQIKKARVQSQKQSEMERLRPKLLTDSFISDRTQPEGRYR